MVAVGATAGTAPAYAAVERPTPAVASGPGAPSVAVQSVAVQSEPAPVESAPLISGMAPGTQASAESASGISKDGLAEAVARDLGMSLADFNAAGAQGKRAADAQATLRKLPGFVTVRLQQGRILVEGSGTELQKGVAALNAADDTGRNEFVLVAPGTTSAPAGLESAARWEAPKAPGAPEAGTASAPNTARSAPEQAPDQETDLRATSVGQLYQAYLREVGAAGLQAVAAADGRFVIRTGGVNSSEAAKTPETAPETADSPETAVQAEGQPPTGAAGEAVGEPAMSPSEFVSQYANVVLEKGEPLIKEEDFLGGQGYRIDGGVVCSAGFSAFSPEGERLVLTAGHCADDGAARLAEVTLPAGDPAGGPEAESGVTGVLGSFGFSQFGGPGNARITGDLTNPGEPGTDIAVIESIRPDLNLMPAATQWEDPANLAGAAVEIVGTAAPFVGQAVCRSGRTDGWSCGTVDEVGIYVVGGSSGEPDDLRSFNGFLSTSVQSRGGDSGGPWISGNYAVGTHSAGNSRATIENFAVAATLQESLKVLPGVELRLFLNRPVLAGALPSGPLKAGQRVSGRVPATPATDLPAGSSVLITLPGREPLNVPVDTDGNWSFTAPAPATQFSAQAINGFSRSEISTFRTAAKPVQPDPVTPSAPAAAGGPGNDSKPSSPQPAPSRAVKPAVLTPAPEPSVVAVQPAGGTTAGEGPAAAVVLADTGVSGLLQAAGVAGAAVLLGGLLLVVVRRRSRR